MNFDDRLNSVLSPKRFKGTVTSPMSPKQKTPLELVSKSTIKKSQKALRPTDKKIVEALLRERPMRKKQKRALSNHVISRWYRPPEIIMIEKNYNQAVDMWSLGCVLAEMIKCTETYRSTMEHVDKRFIFPGSSCFPLTPSK